MNELGGSVVGGSGVGGSRLGKASRRLSEALSWQKDRPPRRGGIKYDPLPLLKPPDI